MDTKIIETARRIAALAQRGEDGERVNAEKLLGDFLAKHGLRLEDLEAEERQWYEFEPLDVPRGDDLWAQCVGSTVDTEKRLLRRNGTLIGYRALLNAREHAEVCMKLAVMVPLYRDELEVWFLSFLAANDLFGLGATDRELTDKEQEQFRRAATMSHFVDRRTVRKGLGSGT